MALIVVSQLPACLREFRLTEFVLLCSRSVLVLIRIGKCKCLDALWLTPLSSPDVHVIAGAVDSLLDPPILVPVQKRNRETVLKQ